MAMRCTLGKGFVWRSRVLRFEQLETRQLLSGSGQLALDDSPETLIDVNGSAESDLAMNAGGGAGNATLPPRQMERLGRGIVVVRHSTTQAYISWRLLGNDPSSIAFNLYRSAASDAPVKLNANPLTTTTDFLDTTANFNVENAYFVRPIVEGVEQDPSESFTLAAAAPVRQYLNVPLQIPTGGTTPSGEAYTYSASDATVGDLDGDGQYEIILKWEPSNSKDNSQSGYTGNVYVDAYTLEGERLWRIDLGINIRAGAHYTQLLVYDFDGDGRAEVVLKTAPGTVDGQGKHVLLNGESARANYRNSTGYIITGPEYLTVFDGLTGAELSTINFPLVRGSASQWGDSYGNRVDRFNATVAYLDGQRPSIVWARGYYGPQSSSGQARNEIVALDFRDGQLTERWQFRAGYNINGNINSEYIGQGTHSISVADVDGDGKDEIIYGASVIDDDGTGLFSTGRGHGDALHVSDMDPARPGLEVFMPHESPSSYGYAGGDYFDALTGELIVGIPSTGDVDRGVAFDIDPNHAGYEFWAAVSGTRMIYNVNGQALYPTNGISSNFGVWWDADPLRELLDGNTISKWRYQLASPSPQTVLTMSGTSSNNGTKSTPSLSADLFGDWREEVIMKASDSSALRIYTTVIPSTTRLFTLMHDSQYRSAIAWQNSSYNQPPHPSFFLGAGMAMPPQPSIYFPGDLPGDFNADGLVDSADYSVWRDALDSNALLPNDTTPGTVTQADYDAWKSNFGATTPPAGSVAVAARSEAVLSASTSSSGALSAGALSYEFAPASSVDWTSDRVAENKPLGRHSTGAFFYQHLEPLLLSIARQQIQDKSGRADEIAARSAHNASVDSTYYNANAFAELGILPVGRPSKQGI